MQHGRKSWEKGGNFRLEAGNGLRPALPNRVPRATSCGDYGRAPRCTSGLGNGGRSLHDPSARPSPGRAWTGKSACWAAGLDKGRRGYILLCVRKLYLAKVLLIALTDRFNRAAIVFKGDPCKYAVFR